MERYYLSIYFYLSLAVFIPFSVFILRFKHIRANKAVKLFSIYTLVDIGVYFAQHILSLLKFKTIIVANIFSSIEFFILTLFYIEVFRVRFRKSNYIIISLITILLLISAISKGTNQYDNWSTMIKSIFFIVLSIIFFWKIMKKQEVESLIDFPLFWLNAGVLVYFSGSIFIMALSNYFLTLSIEAQKMFWLMHTVLNLICYVIFAIGYFKCKQKQTY